MNLRLILGGIAAALTVQPWPARAKKATPPASFQSSPSEPAKPNAAPPPRRVETSTRPSSDLEFKPSAEKDPVAPAPAVQQPARRNGPTVVETPGTATPPKPSQPGPTAAAPTSAKQRKPYVIGPLDVLEVS